MDRYQNGKIYKIIGGDECYIGSTCKKLLSQRMVQHRGDFAKFNRGKKSYTSSFYLFSKYGIENCKIELIKIFPCSCNDELRKEEQYHINNNNCVNIINSYISKEELLKLRNTIQKKYYENNKEKISEREKIYREKNKEKISEREKIYREKNADYINMRNAEKIKCNCGGKYTLGNFSNHKKTKIHNFYSSSVSEL